MNYVDIDFNGLYQSSIIPDLCEEFTKSYNNILQIVEQYIKDKHGKLLLQELRTKNDITQSNTNTQFYYIILKINSNC